MQQVILQMMDLVKKDILKRCLKQKDKQAYYALYKACYSYMMSIIIRYANGNGEEKWMLNLCFSKIVLNLDKYDSSLPFKAWMQRVMINEILDEIRRNKRQNNIKESYVATSTIAQSSFNKGEQNLNYEDLLSLLNKLPNRSKMVFNMFVLDGHSHKAISKKLGISDGTSKWHLSNARKLLQSMIKDNKTPTSTQNILNDGK